MYRDFCDPDYPHLRIIIIITYSLSIRFFVIRWSYLTVEEFEWISLPSNGVLIILELDEVKDKYQFLTPLIRNSNVQIRRRIIRLLEPGEIL